MKVNVNTTPVVPVKVTNTYDIVGLSEDEFLTIAGAVGGSKGTIPGPLFAAFDKAHGFDLPDAYIKRFGHEGERNYS